MGLRVSRCFRFVSVLGCEIAYLWPLAEAEPGEGHELLLTLGEFVFGIHAGGMLGYCDTARG
jgi:hypothetical protein